MKYLLSLMIVILTTSLTLKTDTNILLVSGKIYNSKTSTHITVVNTMTDNMIYSKVEKKRFMIPPLKVNQSYKITFKSHNNIKTINISSNPSKVKKIYNYWVDIDWKTKNAILYMSFNKDIAKYIIKK